jgi:hypothetical protein
MPLAAHTCMSCAAPAVCGSATPSARAAERQRQVFLVQADAKARVEGAFDHAFAVYLQDAAGGKAAHQRLAHARRVGPGLAGKQQRLAHGGDVQRHDDLVGYLAGLAVAGATHMGDVLAHELKQRLDARKRFFSAAHHDGQAGRLGAHFTARHGSVQVVTPQRVDFFSEGFGLHRRDGTHVHHGLARSQPRCNTVLTKQHLLHVRRIWQHHEDDVGLLRDLLRRRTHHSLASLQRLGHFAARGDEHLMPCGDQVARHGGAHDAQAYESKFAHCSFSLSV